MARKGIITLTTDTVTGAARTGVEVAGSAANSVAKAATGAALTAVRGARRLVAVDKPKRRKAKARKAKKAARRKAVVRRSSARGRSGRKRTAKRRAR